MDRLPDLLAASDYVVIAAPHTPKTEKMFGAAQFAHMRPDAYLINIGRGAIVDLAALVEALRTKQIAGAGLDVFEVEPLPAEHALWAFPNVIITPHVAAASSHIAKRHLGVVVENVRRFVGGEPLMNIANKREWF
jgi:phosphoglycerate dehydrogenase-like enzyme